MKYKGSLGFDHAQAPRIGVLITNLGTPEAPEKKALRPYLKQFLSDPRVVEVPRLLWWFILNVIILNVRPARSAEAYATVWEDEGSPLLLHTRDQANALQEALAARHGDRVVVEYAMRYGRPALSDRVQSMFDRGVRKLVVIPMYPQYSGPTGGSTFDALAEDFRARRWLPDLRFVAQYHDHPGYISALADSIRSFREGHGGADKLIFSYHGEPKRYLEEGDPYHCQCHKTTRLVAQSLGRGENDYLTTFQSRFGREEWLQPYTDETLKSLPDQGIKKVQVVCPGFSADCLETIEEIGEENREYFMEAGGEDYAYIPCLNATAKHIDFLADLAGEQMSGWLEERCDPALSAQLATNMGYVSRN
ncbi:MAG: ferrochelatase [Chromatocurvus sp.]